jgi:hypothetical protein
LATFFDLLEQSFDIFVDTKKSLFRQDNFHLTVYHFRGHDSLSLAVFNGIVLWGAADQTGTGYRKNGDGPNFLTKR